MINLFVKQKGFTLIELLVVIALIGLLASIVTVSIYQARLKGQYAKTKEDAVQFIKVIQIAQQESGKRLLDITGSGCSDCICRSKIMRNLPSTDPCYAQWANDLALTQTASAGLVSNTNPLLRDPWGSPYGLDENEREFGPTDCRMDTFSSAGPDGMLYTADDVNYSIPPASPCP